MHADGSVGYNDCKPEDTVCYLLVLDILSTRLNRDVT